MTGFSKKRFFIASEHVEKKYEILVTGFETEFDKMGLLRVFLAFSVVAEHAGTTVFGFKGVGPQYAVNLFFIISGFYMAMILNEKYKDMAPVKFYKSRILRLFPVYYVGLCASLWVSFDHIVDFFDRLSFPAQFFFVFQNLFIIGQDLSSLICAKAVSSECVRPMALTINPPAWSLAVELGFYFVAPYILKRKLNVFIFILFGCCYLISINEVDFPLGGLSFFRPANTPAYGYHFYPSSFVFFGGGALAYYLSQERTKACYLAVILMAGFMSFAKTAIPFWHMPFILLAMPLLFFYTYRSRVDRFIGGLSYPIYILHVPVLSFLKPFTPLQSHYFSFMSQGSMVAIVSCVMGALLYIAIEKNVNEYRGSDAFLCQETSVKNNCASRYLTASFIFLYFSFPVATLSYILYAQNSDGYEPVHASYNLTDSHWTKGIAKDVPGFLVANSSENLDRYQIGKRLRFATGDIREIVRLQQVDSYLAIFVNGDPLSGERVGFPNGIEIIK